MQITIFCLYFDFWFWRAHTCFYSCVLRPLLSSSFSPWLCTIGVLIDIDTRMQRNQIKSKKMKNCFSRNIKVLSLSLHLHQYLHVYRSSYFYLFFSMFLPLCMCEFGDKMKSARSRKSLSKPVKPQGLKVLTHKIPLFLRILNW